MSDFQEGDIVHVRAVVKTGLDDDGDVGVILVSRGITNGYSAWVSESELTLVERPEKPIEFVPGLVHKMTANELSADFLGITKGETWIRVRGQDDWLTVMTPASMSTHAQNRYTDAEMRTFVTAPSPAWDHEWIQP